MKILTRAQLNCFESSTDLRRISCLGCGMSAALPTGKAAEEWPEGEGEPLTRLDADGDLVVVGSDRYEAQRDFMERHQACAVAFSETR